MSNDKCESPPLSDINGVVKKLERDKGSGTTDSADTTLNNAATSPELEISHDIVPTFKFSKTVTTDDIVNVNADTIDFDSFKYVTKESLVKALIYFIKNVNEVNNDLSSVSLPTRANFCCQYDVIAEAAGSNGQVPSTPSPSVLSENKKQVDSTILSHLADKDCFVTPLNENSGCKKFENDKVDKIDKRVDELSKSMSEIKKMLSKIMPTEITTEATVPCPNQITNSAISSSAIVSEDVPTYAGAAKTATSSSFQVIKSNTGSASSSSTRSTKSSEILLVVPNENESKTDDNMHIVKKIVENKLKDTQVEFVKTNPKSMKVIIGFKSKVLRDEGKDIIDSSGGLDSLKYHTKSGSKMLPKLYLSNVSEEILSDVDKSGDSNVTRTAEKNAIIHRVLAKNPCVADLHSIGHTLEVVYINKNVSAKHISIGLKVSPAIRLAIMNIQEGNLYLGNSRYQIKDRYHVKYCYHCQVIGHISTDCPNKNVDPVCLYCMGKHRSSSCNSKDNRSRHCCARCLASTQADDAENYQSHNASDPKCPVMLREIDRLKENTEMSSKNVM